MKATQTLISRNYCSNSSVKKRKSPSTRTDRQDFTFDWQGRRFSFWWDEGNPDYYELRSWPKKLRGRGWYGDSNIASKAKVLHRVCRAWVSQPFYAGLSAARFLKHVLRIANVRWRML